MKTKESLQSPMNANEVDNLNYSNKESKSVYTKVGNTPFNLVGDSTRGYCITLGKYRLTDIEKTKEKALEHVKRRSWNLLTNLIAVMIESNEDMMAELSKNNIDENNKNT